MAEANAQVEESKVEPVVVPQPEPAREPVVEAQQVTKPGGDDGQAVRARKEYERRVEAEQRARLLEERITSLESQLRSSPQPTSQAPKPTLADIDRAIQAGTVSTAEAMAYLAEQKARELDDKREQERQMQQVQARPVEEAAKEVNEYSKLLPGLNDRSDPRWPELQEAALDIQGKLGIPQGPVLAMLALRQVYGPVSKLQRGDAVRESTRQVQAAIQPSGSGAAGSNTSTGNGNKSELLDKVPKALKDAWDKYGTDPKDRVTEAELYFKTQARLNK